MRSTAAALSAWTLFAPAAFAADTEISGRLLTLDGAPLVGVRCFASPSGAPGRGARTWEAEPRGWWKVDVPSGKCPMVFTGPAHFVRPLLLADATAPGKLTPHARFDLATFSEREWDTKAARAYFQTFTARSTSVTHIGFKLATDGVDGVGPGTQEFTLSVHRVGDGAPSTWPQIGPAMPVPSVDCGGPKSYSFSAGWHSGEVPLEPDKLYAVQLRAASGAATCQAFWSSVIAPVAEFSRRRVLFFLVGASSREAKSMPTASSMAEKTPRVNVPSRQASLTSRRSPSGLVPKLKLSTRSQCALSS